MSIVLLSPTSPSKSSTSSSSLYSSSNSLARKRQRPDIFISFRGETRNSFVSHLQNALKNKEAVTFSDKIGLLSGQNISAALHKAIKNASIAIVVFSKDYASSTWCLDELVKILECRNNHGLIVIPIFYDIDPADVRKQNNSFAKSFEEHEAGRFRDQPTTVLSWRNALKEVTALVGEDIRGQDEAWCVKKIVDDVVSRLPSRTLSTRDLVGIESRTRKIKKELNDIKDSNASICWLRIYGEAGSGKTTVARALFDQIRNCFDDGYFLRDAKQVKEKIKNFRKHALYTLARLEEGIIGGEYDNLVVVLDEMDHQKLLLNKRFLLVVDDVDHSEQVEELVSECKWFGGGSKIIITTKNSNFDYKDHTVHKIDLLSDSEAMQLFRKHAFKHCYTQTHHHEDWVKHSLQVVEYAHGHPLLIKVLGSHFSYHQKEKNTDALMNLLDRLEKILSSSETNSSDNIISKLELSFTELSDGQKKMLIDIACLLTRENNTSEDDVNPTDYYSSDFKVLIDKSLIFVNNDREVHMHDLIREMSRTMEYRRLQNELRRYNQLWKRNCTIGEPCPMESNNLRYLLEARKLTIAHAHDPQFSTWYYLPGFRSEVVLLGNLFWLNIEVKIVTKFLPQKTKYNTYILFKLETANEGLEKVKGSVRFTKEIADRDDGFTLYITKKNDMGKAGIWPHLHPHDDIEGLMELKLGTFFNNIGEDGDVAIRMFNLDPYVRKSGLIVVGIEVRIH